MKKYLFSLLLALTLGLTAVAVPTFAQDPETTQPEPTEETEAVPTTSPLEIEVDSSGSSSNPSITSDGENAENIICREGVPVVGTETCEDGNAEGSSSGLLNLFDNILGGLTRLAAAVAIVVIIISGIRFVTSGGDPQGVAGARNAIIYALIALVVAVSAEIIIDFVLRRIS